MKPLYRLFISPCKVSRERSCYLAILFCCWNDLEFGLCVVDLQGEISSYFLSDPSPTLPHPERMIHCNLKILLKYISISRFLSFEDFLAMFQFRDHVMSLHFIAQIVHGVWWQETRRLVSPLTWLTEVPEEDLDERSVSRILSSFTFLSLHHTFNQVGMKTWFNHAQGFHRMFHEFWSLTSGVERNPFL